jgi:Raf kinase inhibitor-like YbhB/YbcL family protein
MPRTIALALISALVLALAAPRAAEAAGFKLTSPTVTDGRPLPKAHVFNAMGCTGRNISPALSWSAPPAGTRSFALTVYDRDAPTGAGWWHWLVYDIPAGTTKLPAGAGSGTGLPAGAKQTRNDFGFAGYGGACPPHGPTHHYIFTLYALKAAHLAIPKGTTPAKANTIIRRNALAAARITATYRR